MERGSRVWIDALLPATLLAGDADALRRGRVLVGFSALMLVAASFAAPYTLSLGYPVLTAAYCIAAAIAVSAPLALRRTGRLTVAANLLALAVFLPLSVATFATGGVGGSGIYLLALLPVIAILVGGLRSGLVWSALCLAEVWTIAWLHAGGFAFAHPLPPDLIIVEQTVGVSFLVVLLGGIAVTYEVLKSRALDDVERARATARAAERVKAEFLANMSHEIRTPLNAVIGLTDLLLDSPLQPAQRDDLETIRASGDVLIAIINDILDLSKIEAGRLELESAPFSLRDCVKQCISLVSAPAAAKGLELETCWGPGVPDEVTSDLTRLRQVLVNLLSNAVKFTPAGKVEVRVEATPREGDRYELHFAVRDTGIGIPAGRQHLLFQPFRQTDASTTRRYGGTGLGLAISARLVELLGGRIRVESAPGAGTTFHVTIVAAAAPVPPAATHDAQALRLAPASAPLAAPAPRPDRKPTDAEAAEPLRILLAEDNAINQKVALRMLAKLGYPADVVANGNEALRALEARRYDVVLMDVHMPELDGLETTRQIVARWPKGKRPCIVAMTASVLEAERHACAAAGMDDFLCKPVSPPALLAALERAARIARSGRSVRPTGSNARLSRSG